jgi:glucose/arabinose dehydrogenase
MTASPFLPRLLACAAASVAFAAQAVVVDPPAAGPLPMVPVATGLQQPVDIVAAGGGPGDLYIVEKPGRIRVVRNGVLVATPVLDIVAKVQACDECGLLGVAFHPSFAQNGYLYVNYTRKPDGATVIARFRVPPGTPDVADPESEVALLSPNQPFPNHNGGAPRFGPDGYLYIGLGDGGSGNDPGNRSQDPTTLLGKLLRIDVDGGSPYAIPPGNPFALGGGRPEIYATGLRNPWKFAFDGDALYIADVGQDQREELNLVPAAASAGANFGWRVLEGTRCTGLGGGAPCDSAGYTPPIVEYDHDTGCSITGGEIYRGSGLPDWVRGRYVFGDFCTGAVYVLGGGPPTATWSVAELGRTGFNIATFGRDSAGNLYVGDFGGGRVLRIGAPDDPQVVDAVEYYYAAGDRYFVTSLAGEIEALDAGVLTGWQRTGLGFRAWPAPRTGSVPICRFWLPPPIGSHFFSADPAECARVQAQFPAFVLETDAAMHLAPPDPASGACPSPATQQPVYRVWNARIDTNHRYTTDPAVRDAMVAAGGVAEGYGPDAVAMCAPR